MTHARLRAAGLVILALIVVGAVALAAITAKGSKPLPPRDASQRPVLLLLTSLPLMFGEDFSLQGGGSPVLTKLQTRYRVVPISVTDPAELAKGKLLLMAHPNAQPAEDLVALDNWVMGGGRVLLLADPMLEWPSNRPRGDPLRPSPMFADTGLLGHWGLTLETPAQRGPQDRQIGGFRVATVSPGELSGRCSIRADKLIADCRVGKGRAIVIGDADWLNVEQIGGAEENLDALLAELARLERA
jgi:hypothetical protein